jgi:hypothetical protein
MLNRISILLIVDAVINYALGILCILYTFIAGIVGVPIVENSFYPNILGAVLLGIGIALTLECFKTKRDWVGLGLGGAVAINLSGGVVLVIWLIFGNLNIPIRGQVFLWMLAIFLIIISTIELIAHVKNAK